MKRLAAGFLVLDKPSGLTSQETVFQVRKCLDLPKAGHTGTLDPLATGVLPVAWGEATKVIPFLDEARKEYLVEGILGISTDTYDSDGTPALRGDYTLIFREDLEKALEGFRGEVEQIPPLYSAVKIGGRPAYRYARKGEDVPRPSRNITVRRIELTSFDPPRFALSVACSRGTYVRSLVHDLGVALGCFAHVCGLKRLKTGDFTLAQALSLTELEEHPLRGWERALSIEQALPDIPKISLEASELDRVRQGARLPRVDKLIETQGILGETLALTDGNQIHALWKRNLQGEWKYARVLNRS